MVPRDVFRFWSVYSQVKYKDCKVAPTIIRDTAMADNPDNKARRLGLIIG